MMRGSVSRLHALLPVTFRLTGRQELAIEFVVDTGYTGSLTLPMEAVEALGLQFEFDLPAGARGDQPGNLTGLGQGHGALAGAQPQRRPALHHGLTLPVADMRYVTGPPARAARQAAGRLPQARHRPW